MKKILGLGVAGAALGLGATQNKANAQEDKKEPSLSASYTPKISLEEIQRLKGEIENLNQKVNETRNTSANHFRVKDPNGHVHFFRSQDAANRFKVEAGIS
jgi:hypothetical protein